MAEIPSMTESPLPKPEMMSPQESRVKKIFDATGAFIADVQKANELAKTSIEKSTAIQHILKGAGVAVAGVTGEVLSSIIWESVEGAIGKKAGKEAQSVMEALGEHPVLKEIVENVGIMAAYNWASSQMGGALPKIPMHYLGLSAAIDVFDKGVLSKGKRDDTRTWLDYSNAVTDAGIGMIVGGALTFAKEFKRLRKVRKQAGKVGVEQFVVSEQKKASAEKTTQRLASIAERMMKRLEENGGT